MGRTRRLAAMALASASAAVALALLSGAGHKTPANIEVAAVYPVPIERELQSEISDVCQDYRVSPAVVMAIIRCESGYNAGASGDGGKAIGLMQIQPQWHWERMRRLGVTDLCDPVQNVMVGVDYLAELIAEYGDLSMALIAYNAGRQGAIDGWFNAGLYESDYSREVLAEAQMLVEGAVTYVIYE